MNRKILGITALLSILGSAIFVTAAFGQATPTAQQLQSQLQNLLQQLQQLQSQLPAGGAQAIGNVVIPTLTRNFCVGATDATTGGEVSRWQDFLVRENKGPKARVIANLFASGIAKGYFGGLTGDATVEWQQARGISATAPCVGGRTRAVVTNLGQSWESSFNSPYPVSWSDWNRAQVSLTKASLTKSQSYYELRLYFKVNGTGFCSSTLKQTLKRLVSGQEGDRVAPVTTSSDCTTGGETLYNQEVVFTNIPVSEQEITILSIPGYNDPAWQQTSFKLTPQADGSIRVVAAGGQTATPVISSISPTSGPRNSLVTITGSGFTVTNNTVKFTGNYIKVVTGIASTNGTSLTFSVPATIDPPFELPLGIYSVSVMNSNGTSNSVNFTVTGSPQSGVPTITNISPTSGPVGTYITITGSGFTRNLNRISSNISGVLQSNAFSTDGASLTFVLPQQAISGLHRISITNANGTSNTIDFTVPDKPTISSISQASGPVGTTVTITGSRFTSAGNTVTLAYSMPGDLPLTQWYFSASQVVGSVNGTTLTFTVPPSGISMCSCNPPTVPISAAVMPRSYNLTVTNTNGTSNSVNFTVTANPSPPPAGSNY